MELFPNSGGVIPPEIMAVVFNGTPETVAALSLEQLKKIVAIAPNTPQGKLAIQEIIKRVNAQRQSMPAPAALTGATDPVELLANQAAGMGDPFAAMTPQATPAPSAPAQPPSAGPLDMLKSLFTSAPAGGGAGGPFDALSVQPEPAPLPMMGAGGGGFTGLPSAPAASPLDALGVDAVPSMAPAPPAPSTGPSISPTALSRGASIAASSPPMIGGEIIEGLKAAGGGVANLAGAVADRITAPPTGASGPISPRPNMGTIAPRPAPGPMPFAAPEAFGGTPGGEPSMLDRLTQGAMDLFAPGEGGSVGAAAYDLAAQGMDMLDTGVKQATNVIRRGSEILSENVTNPLLMDPLKAGLRTFHDFINPADAPAAPGATTVPRPTIPAPVEPTQASTSPFSTRGPSARDLMTGAIGAPGIGGAPAGGTIPPDLSSLEPVAEEILDGSHGPVPAALRNRAQEVVDEPSDSPNFSSMLMRFGLALMAAGGRPGATLGGSIGRAGLATLAQYDAEVRANKAARTAAQQTTYDRGRDDIADDFKEYGLWLDTIEVQNESDLNTLLTTIKQQNAELDRSIRMMQIGVQAENAITNIKKNYDDAREELLGGMPLDPDAPGSYVLSEQIKALEKEKFEAIARVLRQTGQASPANAAGGDGMGTVEASPGFGGPIHLTFDPTVGKAVPKSP